MNQTELRRFFLRLTSLAAPVPLVLACGGTVASDSQRLGAESDGGGGTGGTSGYPFLPGTGGAMISGGSGGTGGYPYVAGTGGGYYGPGGSGGNPTVGGGGELDGGSVSDANRSHASDAPADGPGDGGAIICADASDAARPQGCGRRPPGLEGAPAGVGSDLCRFFQEMARLEAASVPAFRRLGHELRLHGAPLGLRAAARRAARDEVVHTRLGRELAERFGGAYLKPRIRSGPPRSLEELAIDNAVEGCVRETFGAVIATWQGRAAADAVVRRVMRRVAVDETRHAALALRVAEWSHRQLSSAARRRVLDARRQAARDITREVNCEPSAELLAIAGVPGRRESVRLARAMTERLWS